MNKKFRYISFGIFCVTLIGLQINSAVWFRMKLADYYKSNCEYVKAIKLYDKILRRNSVKGSLDSRTFSEINFDLGYLYRKLNLSNLAIESYTAGSEKFIIDIKDSYYVTGDLEKDKLPALGLLEAAKWNRAIKEFQRLKQFHPNSYGIIDRYIKAVTILKNEGLTPAVKDFYFKIGDAYIQSRLFNEAKSFFTKRILDYGIEPVPVLAYLQKKYGNNTQVVKDVWGDDIYVTLEDFETVRPRLNKWVSNIWGKVYNHCITDEAAYKGYRSEFFDISYTGVYKGTDRSYGGDYYYLVKIVNIPLQHKALNLGLRLFIKNNRPYKNNLCFNTLYTAAGESGICGASSRKEMGNDWWQYKIEGLFKIAKFVAADRRWDIDRMVIDKVMVDTKGICGIFFIDEIELYLTWEAENERTKQLSQ